MRLRPPSPKTWARVHLSLTAAWTLLMVPSLLWWQESVPWLVTMSCYANVAGSAASWMAARADRDSPTREDLVRIERKIETLGHRMGRR